MPHIRPLLLIACLCVFGALTSPAAPPRRIPIEDFFKDPQYSGADISPDGKRIAFLAPDHNRMNIWICNTGASLQSAKLVTHDTEHGIWDFQWTKDSRFLLYLRDSAGDENYHIFRLDLSAPDEPAVDLTPVKGARATIMHLAPNQPAEAWIRWNNRDPSQPDLGILNIQTGAYKKVVENPPFTHCILWDHDGRFTAYARPTRSGKVDIEALDAGDSSRAADFRTVATFNESDYVTLCGFNADRSILYLSSTRGSDTMQIRALDVKTGEETTVAGEPDYDISTALMSKRTDRLLGIACEKERSVMKAIDPGFQRDLKILSQALPAAPHIGAISDDEKKWIVTTDAPANPPSTYLYDQTSGKVTLLYHSYPWLKSGELAEMKPIAFQSRDGLKLHGYLTIPRGAKPRGLPTILLVHGGPWERDVWGYDPLVQFLANRGYAVVQVNFRGSTGYGKRFYMAGQREWGGKMLDDVIDGADWLVKEGIADPKRLGICGGSYGGYAALSALAFHPKVFACGVDISGPSNLLTFLQNGPAYWATERERLDRDIGNPDKDAEFLKSRSPLFSVDKIEAPLFIAQGENDPRVKRSESDQMVEALKKNGRPVEYMLTPDEGHGFAKIENNRELCQRIEAFLDKYLK